MYDLDLWGKNRSALAAALDSVQVSTAEAQEVQLALETRVVRVYVQLSLQCRLKDIGQTTLKQRQDILDITQKRFKAGIADQDRPSAGKRPPCRGHDLYDSRATVGTAIQQAAVVGRRYKKYINLP